MRVPSAAELLDVWEQGAGRSPAQQALLLLGAANDDLSLEQLPRLPVGRRDARLLALRERLFGTRVDGLATCPACSGRVELQFRVADIRVPEPGPAPETFHLDGNGLETVFRLPTGLDLCQLPSGLDTAERRLRLLQNCLLSARRDGSDIPADALHEDEIIAIADQMSAADPQAGVRLDVRCPQCEHAWLVPFDIGQYLWSELHTWAHRLLREIHTLATAYGWSEAAILSLSPWRRQAYLELLGG